jgi:hypothetical protein
MKKIKMSTEQWFDQAIEILLPEDDSFLIVKETLTRIGIASMKDGAKRLAQTCHILQKRGKFYIVHFKELLLLDGKEANFSEEDAMRRNTIAQMLEDWGLVEIVDIDKIYDQLKHSSVKVVPFKEKDKWELVPKYNIGGRKN